MMRKLEARPDSGLEGIQAAGFQGEVSPDRPSARCGPIDMGGRHRLARKVNGLLRFGFAVILWGMSSTWGCASPNLAVRARRLPDGRVEVDGPLAGPFPTTEELAANACEIIIRQPGASNGLAGFEYCAVYYYSRTGKGYFLSYLSDIKNKLDTAVKSCVVPAVLNDKVHLDAIIIGKGHNHPHNRQFSLNDLSIANHAYPSRAVDKETGRVWNRGLMLFYREKTGECRAYHYDNVTRLVSALRGGQWVTIGRAYDEIGNVQMLEGMDWLPLNE